MSLAFTCKTLINRWVFSLSIFSLQAFATEQPAAPLIAALTPNSVELLYEIGAGEQIIATVEFADYPEAAKTIARVGRYSHIDLEALLVLKPDLIIVSDETSPTIQAQLKSLNIPLFNSSVDRIDDIAARMVELGVISGHQQQAQQAASRFNQRLDAIRQQYQYENSVGVLFQIWGEPLTAGASPWLNQMVENCGGHNVITDTPSEYPQLSMEQILVTSPQVILKPLYPGSIEHQQVAWQDWPEIPAVNHQQIYTLNADHINRAGPRVLLGMTAVCEALAKAHQIYDPPM
jgi:vitamin B12 transport system substrate-binding protein